jgi:AbrB family looped-hinge helix DNA binding protein
MNILNILINHNLENMMKITSDQPGCCQVEAVTSVDERGQMVLPKDIRDKAGIKAGDKLAVITWRKQDSVCCITFVKADELTAMVKDLLGPMAQELVSR